MNVAVVLGPELSGLEDSATLADAVRVRTREPGASAGDRARALRTDLAGADAALLVDRALPVRPDWSRDGAIVALVADHLNLTGDNPLVGPNADEWGPRFPDMTGAYAPELRAAIRHAAVEGGVELREGVLAGVAPGTRTGAEVSMLRMLGADMASEGIVHETITARHAGRGVAALALLASGTPLPGDLEHLERAVGLALDALIAATPAGTPDE